MKSNHWYPFISQYLYSYMNLDRAYAKCNKLSRLLNVGV